MASRATRVWLRHFVAVLVPSVEQDGKPIDLSRMNLWVERWVKLFTQFFGGATPMPLPGPGGYEHRDPTTGQQITQDYGTIMVRADCESRDSYLQRDAEICALAEEMKEDLSQESVFVFQGPSDSYFLF